MAEKLTKKDVEKIKNEIEHRRLVIRHDALDQVKVARAHGDLSENFEYYAAKKYKNENESRITYLEGILKNAEIIDDEFEGDDAHIGLNSIVDVCFDFNEKSPKDFETYKIVTSIRSNSLKKLISIESPLGKALIGKGKGDIAKVTLENGTSYELKIVDMKTTDDESEDIKSY